MEGNRWIPVSEEMPEEDNIYCRSEEVLISYKSESINGVWISYTERGHWMNFDSKVDAWMPLPNPYEEEREAYLERLEQSKAIHDNLMEDIAWNRKRGIED